MEGMARGAIPDRKEIDMNSPRSALEKTKPRMIDGKPAGLDRVPLGFNRIYGNGNHRIRHRVYDFLVGPVTHLCYEAGLNYFHDNAAILDVGIGNGCMIPHFHSLIKSKGFKITGIDINAAALAECARRIQTHELEDQIELHRSSIEDFQPQSCLRYDYIFFSMTFMLMDNQKAVLDRVLRMIAGEGQIVFFQTMYGRNIPIMNFIKPKLKYLTGIEFGPVTYDGDFFGLLKDRRMAVKEDRLLQKTWFKGEYRIIVASPELGTNIGDDGEKLT